MLKHHRGDTDVIVVALRSSYSCRFSQMSRRLAFLCALAVPGSLHAAEFFCSSVACLITTIDRANDNGEATNIINLDQGVYRLTEPFNNKFSLEDGPAGLPAVSSKLAIIGMGSAATIIERDRDGANGAPLPFRIFNVSGSGELTLHALTIRHGLASQSTPIYSGVGGGILNNGGIVKLTETMVTDNTASRGIGIGGVNRAAWVVADTKIIDNSFENSFELCVGGAVDTDGSVTVLNSTISGNTISGNNPCPGIVNRGGRVSLNNVFLGPLSHPGLLNAEGGTVTIANSTVGGNSSPADSAAGIQNRDQGSTVNITNSLIMGNRSSDGPGGGIGNSVGTVNLTNTTVFANTAFEGGGGGIQNRAGGVVRIINTTIADNNNTNCSNPDNCRGSGIKNIDGMVTLQNSIVVNRNPGTSDNGDCFGVVTSLGSNIIDNPGDCRIDLIDPTERDFFESPHLGDFAENGTPGNGHVPLLADSIAIDRGNEAACPVVDQLLQGRVDGSGSGRMICDIGAVEFNGAPLATANRLVDFQPISTSFSTTSDVTGCPVTPPGFVGTFRFEATLINNSFNLLSNLLIRIVTLTGDNLLQNSIGQVGAAGGILAVPKKDQFADGQLGPNESLSLPLVICLREKKPFSFFVDVLSTAP